MEKNNNMKKIRLYNDKSIVWHLLLFVVGISFIMCEESIRKYLFVNSRLVALFIFIFTLLSFLWSSFWGGWNMPYVFTKEKISTKRYGRFEWKWSDITRCEIKDGRSVSYTGRQLHNLVFTTKDNYKKCIIPIDEDRVITIILEFCSNKDVINILEQYLEK